VGKNIFIEGTFDVFGDSRLKPIGWNFPNEDDSPWKAGFRATVVKGETGHKELLLVSPDSNGYVGASARLPLPAKLQHIRVSYRVFAKSLELGVANPAGNGAGVYLRFLDKSGRSMRELGWVASMVQASAAEWQEREQIFDVPAEADSLAFEVILRSAKGEVRFDDIKVVPVATNP